MRGLHEGESENLGSQRVYAPSTPTTNIPRQTTETHTKNVESEEQEGVFQRTDSVTGSKIWFSFSLPGQGEPNHYCGEFYCVGHLECGYIEKRMKSCFRADCPICRQKWAGRLAGRAEYRIGQVTWLGPSKHITISLPDRDYGLVQTDYPGLRRKVTKILKRVGVKGGLLVFHPARRRCPRCGLTPEMGHCICVHCGNPWFEWYFSPHFHIVGFGWIDDVGDNFTKSGYIVVNLGIRETVSGTVLYILSHAGVHSKYKVLTWFGACSYNKLLTEPDERRGNECPTCGAKLRPCKWMGLGPSPLEGKPEGQYYIDTASWQYTARYRHGEWDENGCYHRGHYEGISGIPWQKEIQLVEMTLLDF